MKDNFRVAKYRSQSLERNLNQNIKMKEQYAEILREYLQQDIIEEVNETTLVLFIIYRINRYVSKTDLLGY